MLKKRTTKDGRGAFIVIEGTDGSGKATQFKLLKERLAAEGYEVASFDFPQYDKPSSHFVRNYLNGVYGGINDIGPYTGSLFFALDRYEAANEIRQALDQGKIVLANRFTGSSMAHQGTKFTHAEERRGFFIWLDNLEFGLLSIPRPDMNFVLRVPAKTAQKLVDKKEARTYTNETRDLHEADLAHLEKSVEVYDDLCRLFPKDFSELDCVRNGELMPIENIQSLLWEKVRTILPPPISVEKTSSTEHALAGLQEKSSVTHEDRIQNPLGKYITLENTSCLLAQNLEFGQSVPCLKQTLSSIDLDIKNNHGKYRYFTPESFDSEIRFLYENTMDSIFELYSEMVQRLTGYIQKHPNLQKERKDTKNHHTAREHARTILQPVLPVATQLTISLFVSHQTLENLLARLSTDNLFEATEKREEILTEIKVSMPSLLKEFEKAPQENIHKAMQTLTDQLLSGNYASDTTKPVTLTDVWPRNELDIVADMLYEHSDLPLEEIRNEIATWTYEQKQAVIQTYVGDSEKHHKPGRALEKVRYSFDLLCDYDTFRNIQSRYPTADNLVRQQLTPRYGYEVPDLVDEAGLTELFERCFDSSLELHSKLQAAGYKVEAQYATLLGHKMRGKITYNARETFYNQELRATLHGHPGYQKLVQQMYDTTAAIHPLLVESMKFVNKNEDEELT